MTRRDFVRGVGGGLALAGLGPLWLRPALARDAAAEPLLVVVFLRGAADALHLAPPRADADYGRLRGSLAIDSPRPFTPEFGLHPALEALDPLVRAKQLALVVNAGSPHATRSHFEAQDFMEAGEPGSLRADGGWMARALGPTPEHNAFATVALSGALPLSLRGSGAFALASSFDLPASEATRAALEARYAAEGGALGRAGVRALAALREFEAVAGSRRARRWARRPRVSLVQAADQLLSLERAGLPIRAAFLESSGWDTHQGQGADQGQMARPIRDLGDAIARLAAGLEERRNWLVVVQTEFGRTVRPNGSAGTDHGHGAALLLAGPRVRGGVHGEWRGLAAANLYEGRDLPVTTDFRHVLFEVLQAHLGAPPPAATFPEFAARPLGLIS